MYACSLINKKRSLRHTPRLRLIIVQNSLFFIIEQLRKLIPAIYFTLTIYILNMLLYRMVANDHFFQQCPYK